MWCFVFFDNCDENSRVVWIFILINKKELSCMMLNFLATVERPYNKQVKIVPSNDETIYLYEKLFS